MKVLSSFDPSVVTSGKITTLQGSANASVYLINESNQGLNLKLGREDQNIVLPAWFTLLVKLKYAAPIIDYSVAYSLSSSNSPISLVIGFSFDGTEDTSNYTSGPLVRLVNIGSTVQSSVSAAQQLSNTGNPTPTNIINVQPSDAASATVTADNQGNFTWKLDNAGVLTTILQFIAGASQAIKLGAASVLVEILGALQVDTNLTVKGSSSLDNGSITTDGAGKITIPNNRYIQSLDTTAVARNLIGMGNDNNNRVWYPTGQALYIEDANSTKITTFNASGITLNAGKFQWPSGSLSDISSFTGTGSGTYSHGLNTTPFWCCPVMNVAGSSSIGYDTPGSTTIHVTIGAGAFSFRAFVYG